MTETEEMETEFTTWVKMLKIGLDSDEKNVSRFAVREIESIISRVVANWNLFDIKEEIVAT